MEDLVLYLTSVFDSPYFADIPEEVKQVCYAVIITTVALVFFLSCMLLLIVSVLCVLNLIRRR